MASKEVGKETNEILDREFGDDLEGARARREMEALEKKEAQLWLLGLLLILVLILWGVTREVETLIFAPGEYWERFTSLSPSALIFPVALCFLGFCAFLLFRNRSIRAKRKEVFLRQFKPERAAAAREESSAVFQVSSGIAVHKEPNAILEMIVREAMGCLKAHRSTFFLSDEKTGALRAQSTRAADPLKDQVGLFEEKEVARKALRQKKPCFLREPGDFSEFLNYEERERKITSLLSVPVVSQGGAAGVLSVALIDEARKFTQKDLQFLMTLGNLACLSMETSYFQEEVRKAANFRKNYDQYLDHILSQLEGLSGIERKRIEDHIGSLLPVQSPGEKVDLADQEEVVKGAPPPVPESMPAAIPGKDQASPMVRMELDSEPLAFAQDLGDDGVFIQTADPLDLGEQFVLKLQLAKGEEPVEVTCKVIWTNKYGKESRNLRRGMGVRFLNLSPQLQSRVEEYIRSRRDRQLSVADETK